MFKKIVVAVFLVPTVSFAQIGRQIIKQIEKVNEGGIGVPKNADPCSECDAPKSAAGIFAACVKEVCEDKGLLPYTAIPAISYEDLTKPATGEKDVEALFDKMSAIKSPLDTDEERKKMYDMLEAGKFSMTEDNLDLAFQFMTVNVGSQVIKWNMQTYRAEFDEEKFNKIPLPLSDKNKAAMREKAKAFVTGLPSIFELSNSGVDSPDSYLSTKYPGLSKVDAVKKLTADFRKDYEEFKQSGLGKLFSKIADGDIGFPTELVQEIESGKDVTDMALKDLIASKGSFTSLKLYFSSGSDAANDKIDYDDLRERMKTPAQIASVIEHSKKEKANEEVKKKDGKISCLSTYRKNMLSLPSSQQIKDLKEAIGEIKKEIGDKWASKYSVHTQQKIADYLKKVEFFLPYSKDDYSNGFKQRIQREIQTQTRNASLNIKDRESLAFFFVLSGYVKNFSSSESGQDNDSEKYSEFCDKDKVSALNDANYTLLGKIQVSHTSAHALEMGKGVLAHELGHGISQIFRSKSASDESSKKHQSILSCLGSLHGPNGSQFNEEDYADFVASNVTKVNLSCLFPQEYSYGTKMVENAYPTDPHSSSFFRLMHIESLQKGKVPDNCNSFLVEQGTPKDFNSCQKIIDSKEAGVQ